LWNKEGMSYATERIFHNLVFIGEAARVFAGRWLRRHRVRRLLRELDARQLAELGLLTRDQVAEAAKWFWEK
jgi:uncharacterized protein YjiS (DUF1127 family)